MLGDLLKEVGEERGPEEMLLPEALLPDEQMEPFLFIGENGGEASPSCCWIPSDTRIGVGLSLPPIPAAISLSISLSLFFSNKQSE